MGTARDLIRVAVVGTGSLGQHHARIYAEMAASGAVEFAGVFDVNPEAARLHASKHGVRAFASVAEVAAAADAVSIVTPTVTHFAIASELIGQGRHVLVEKPMTDNAADATALVELARARGCILQVGHIERFNPVFSYLDRVAGTPRFIEAQRLSPFPARSTDIGVVLDLMIHDLDIVLAFVKSPVAAVEAVGLPVLSQSEDIANARIRFANGCIANLTASRVSAERCRKIRVFCGGASPCYITLNYQAQEGFIYRVARDGEAGGEAAGLEAGLVSAFGGRRILREPVPVAKEEPLKLELRHFVECVREGRQPLVDGEAAKRALELAFEITRQVRAAGQGTALPG